MSERPTTLFQFHADKGLIDISVISLSLPMGKIKWDRFGVGGRVHFHSYSPKERPGEIEKTGGMSKSEIRNSTCPRLRESNRSTWRGTRLRSCNITKLRTALGKFGEF